MEPQYTVSCSRVNAIGSGTFVLAFTHLTRESCQLGPRSCWRSRVSPARASPEARR